MDKINFFRFYSQYPISFVALLTLVFFLVSFFSYKRLLGVVSRGKFAVLVALRTLIFFLLIMFLLNPTLGFVSQSQEKPTVAVLADTSRSMTLPAADGRKQRIENVRRFLAAHADGAKSGEEELRLKFFSFDRAARNITPAQFETLEAEGNDTRMDYGLRVAGQSIRDLNPAGIILLSDGRLHNNEQDSLQAAATLPCPVYTVVFGSDKRGRETVRNAGLKQVECPGYGRKDKTMAVKAVIAHSGYDRQAVSVELREEGRTIKTRSIMLSAAQRQTALVFDYTPESVGRKRLEVVLADMDEEQDTSDNRRSFSVLVTGSTNRVLLMCGKLQWDYTFLSRLLAGEGGIDTDSFVRVGADTWLLNGRTLRGKGLFEDRNKLFAYSAVILLDIEADYFSRRELTNLTAFVFEKGGGLCVAGTGAGMFGPNAYPAGPLAPALPVKSGNSEIQLPAAGDTMLPSREGIRHMIFQVAGMNRKEMQRAWTRLPVPDSFIPITAVRESAEGLLSVKRSGRDFPILAGQQYGLGRSTAFPVSGTWRWALKPADQGLRKMYEKFWLQMLHWLLQTGSGDIDRMAGDNFIITDKQSYTAGEGIRVQLKSSLLTSQEAVTAEVTTPDERKENLILRKTSPEGELFEGGFTAQTDGIYRVSVPDLKARSKEGEAELQVEVLPDMNEIKNVYADSALMKRLAAQTEGKAFAEEDMEKVWDAIKADPLEKTKIEEKDMTANWYFFFLVLLLLGAEWVLRKSYGLG